MPKLTLILYDPRDLTTHAIMVGMTGSGKTGLAMALLEEAAIDGIPSILIYFPDALDAELLARSIDFAADQVPLKFRWN